MTTPDRPPLLGAHLSHVGLQVEAPARLATFYERAMGLAPHEVLADGSRRLGFGRGHHCLEIARGSHGLGHFALEVPDEQRLESVLARVSGAGHDAEHVSEEGEHPACFVLSDPDGHRIELHGRVDRSGEHSADPGRRPTRVQHITLATPNLTEMTSFYEEILGLRVSDRMSDVFVWLRANTEHHTVALVRSDRADIDHYSYDVDSWADFKVWCDELASRGVPIAWGPGRHGPGNNLFVIFEDAAGFRVELSAEMERFWDDRADYEPRVWEARPETVNLWGPTPSWREDVAGREAADRE